MFFAKPGEYKPVGMFSVTHYIVIVVCFVAIISAVFLSRKMTQKTYFNLLLITAVALSILETIKIVWTLVHGMFKLSQWVPLYFCSLFIYALWMAVSRNNMVKEVGLSYISLGAIVAGASFIAFPTTSFNTYPLFHFLSIYSMVYHSLMVYVGIMFYLVKPIKLTWMQVIEFCIFTLIAMLLAIVLNTIDGSNLMFVSKPGNIPLPILHVIYQYSPFLFTLFIILAHLSMSVAVYAIFVLSKRYSDNDRLNIKTKYKNKIFKKR